MDGRLRGHDGGGRSCILLAGFRAPSLFTLDVGPQPRFHLLGRCAVHVNLLSSGQSPARAIGEPDDMLRDQGFQIRLVLVSVLASLGERRSMSSVVIVMATQDVGESVRCQTARRTQ